MIFYSVLIWPINMTDRGRFVWCRNGCNTKLFKDNREDHIRECKANDNPQPIPCRHGCGENILVKNGRKHARTCKALKIECKNGCGELIRKNNRTIQKHNKICLNKKQSCKYCNFYGTIKQLEDHYPTCDNYGYIECPYNCGIVYKENSHHNCPNKEISCRYNCSFRCKPLDMDKHERDIVYHFNDLYKKISLMDIQIDILRLNNEPYENSG